MADRIAGLVVLAFAIIYGLGASRLESGFGSGPVGPKLFPTILATLIGVCAIAMQFRTDPPINWPKGSQIWLKFLLLIAAFLFYAYGPISVRQLGFIISTSFVTAVVSIFFGAKFLQSIVVGVLASTILYAIFVFGLDLSLPIGNVFN